MELKLVELRELYKRLKKYRNNPTAEFKEDLSKMFDGIVNAKTGLPLLDHRLELTKQNKSRLLYVLYQPQAEIHTNLIERDLRKKVIKRKVSLFNRSWSGVKAWDQQLSLMRTFRKNGVGFYNFLKDRYSNSGKIPYLGQIIALT